MNRIDALKAVAQNLGDLILDSTVASVTGSSIRADDIIQTQAQQMAGFYWYADGGAGLGQSRVIGSLNAVAREIFFPQAWGSTPSTNTTFFITEKFSKSDYDSSLDRYIGKARLKHLQERVATLSLVGTQYEYPVPSGFEWISTLRLVPSLNTDYAATDKIANVFEIPARYWRIEVNALGTYIIVFDSRKFYLPDFNNYWVNVEGQVKPEIGATDNATIPAELEEYVINGASMLQASKMMGKGDEWAQKFGMFRSEQSALDDNIFRYGHGRKVR